MGEGRAGRVASLVSASVLHQCPFSNASGRPRPLWRWPAEEATQPHSSHPPASPPPPSSLPAPSPSHISPPLCAAVSAQALSSSLGLLPLALSLQLLLLVFSAAMAAVATAAAANGKAVYNPMRSLDEGEGGRL